MKVKVWIKTDKVGSKCVDEVEIEDGLDETEIDEVLKDTIWNMAEWGWEEIK